MNSIETFNIVDKGEYKSISSIEKLNGCAFIKMDYEYKLNLVTKSKYTCVIYLYQDSIFPTLIKPIKDVLEHKSSEETITISNKIKPEETVYYDFINHIKNKFLHWLIKYNGCNYNLKLTYNIECDRYLVIKPSISFTSFIFKHRPKEIQPTIIPLSFDDAENFLGILECL